MNLLVTFIVFNLLNVVIQTIKAICTIRCNKYIASLVNAIAFGLYTYIVVLTVCELDLWVKILVVALVNLVGVFVVKLIEEKTQKEKLWKIEVSVLGKYQKEIKEIFQNIPFSYIENLGEYTLFNFYCDTKKDSEMVKNVCQKYGGKYFATESKSL